MILSQDMISILLICVFIPFKVSGCILKFSCVANRIARNILRGSSLNVTSGSLGVINAPLLRSEIPFNGSDNFYSV